nr:NUDIX domain-containing protein [Paracoccaceae bacterium]
FAAFGAAERPASAETSQGKAVEVHLAPATPAPLRRLDEPCEPEWRAHLAEAALEAMGHFGLRPAETMPDLMRGVSYRALARVRGRTETVPAGARRGLSAGDVEPAGVARPYAKYFAVEEHRLRHRRYDGRMSGIVERAVFASGDAVTVVPFDVRRRRLLLIEQFRIGPFARRDPRPWRLEAVAGRCDAGEGPEATARREAREEAGVELGRIERIGGYYTSPGMMAEHITAYVGEADLERVGGVHGLPEEEEDIRAVVLPLAEALDLVASGEVNNGPLLVSLLWLGGQAERLAEAWS